jgi:hypothetical protein
MQCMMLQHASDQTCVWGLAVNSPMIRPSQPRKVNNDLDTNLEASATSYKLMQFNLRYDYSHAYFNLNKTYR